MKCWNLSSPSELALRDFSAASRRPTSEQRPRPPPAKIWPLLEYHLGKMILHSSEYFGVEKNWAQRAQFIKRTAGLVCIAQRCGAFAVRSLHMHNTHMHGQPDGMAFCKRAEAWLGSRDLSCTWKWYKDIFEHLMFSEFWLVERQKHHHFANLDINEIVKWIVVHKSLFSVVGQNDVKKREIEVPLYSHGP